MRRLPLVLLRPGMSVARSVYNTDGRVLLAAGMTLKTSFIERLDQLGVTALYVDDPLLEDVDIEALELISKETHIKAVSVVKEFMIGIKDKKKRSPIREINNIVDQVITELLDKKMVMVNLADIRTNDDYTFGHSVNVALLALVTGVELGYTRDRLNQLGIGALLHDLGKVDVPEVILRKPGTLTTEEFSVVKHHSNWGYECLRRQGEISLPAAHVALEHHERFDGSGYPRGLKGNEITEFACIVSITDVYDALTAERVYRPAYLPHEAYEMLAGAGNLQFDYRMIQAFLNRVVAYPVGTVVSLNTGQTGIVVDNPPGFTHRPRVRINKDGETAIKPYDIDLADDMRVNIVRVHNPQAVSDFLEKRA